uniref:Fibroblast growth factor 18 n=1 Tax=Chrysolophus pictus TaxID=9089 RepID=A0A8C3LAI6_CHRPC
MYSLLSACTCLCLHFLLLCFQVQMFVAEENVDFRIHVENQTRARDDVSRKQLRLYQLYSRTSGKHIQVLGRRISAKGEDGDKYGKNIYWDPPDFSSKALIHCVGLRTSWEKNEKSNKMQRITGRKKKKPKQNLFRLRTWNLLR